MKNNNLIIFILLFIVVVLASKQTKINSEMKITEGDIRTKELAIDRLNRIIESHQHSLIKDSIRYNDILKEDSLMWAKKLRKAKKLTSKERLNDLVGNVSKNDKDTAFAITEPQIDKIFNDVLDLKMQNSKLGLENAQLNSVNENQIMQIASYKSIAMNYDELEFLEDNLKKQMKAKHRKQLLRVGGVALGAGLILGLIL